MAGNTLAQERRQEFVNICLVYFDKFYQECHDAYFESGTTNPKYASAAGGATGAAVDGAAAAANAVFPGAGLAVKVVGKPIQKGVEALTGKKEKSRQKDQAGLFFV